LSPFSAIHLRQTAPTTACESSIGDQKRRQVAPLGLVPSYAGKGAIHETAQNKSRSLVLSRDLLDRSDWTRQSIETGYQVEGLRQEAAVSQYNSTPNLGNKISEALSNLTASSTRWHRQQEEQRDVYQSD
jgi:selenocysteine-specific translation elongation factor